MSAESTLDVFARDGVAVAIDTESDGASTLSVQVVARDEKGRLQAQIYHAPEIPVPAGFRAKGQLQGLARLVKNLRCRPPKILSARLSPARMLADVFGFRDVTPVSRAAGLARLGGMRKGQSSVRCGAMDLVSTCALSILVAAQPIKSQAA
jgi:hypothetical protein